MTAAACWVCGGERSRLFADRALSVDECRACGHLEAVHAVENAPARDADAAAPDYHLQYDQAAFADSLAATRRRQALLLAGALQRVTPARSVFDFGCGRGWLLQTLREQGFGPLAGGDTSAHALSLLAAQKLSAVALDPDEPLRKLDFSALEFLPQIVTFLDVLEHFSGDRLAGLGAWLASAPAREVSVIVVKVPVREGLLFGLARAAREVGVAGLIHQLFQVGTFPPHYQYFSQTSLDRFVSQLGFRQLLLIDDPDFEPESLRQRARALALLPSPVVTLAGRALFRSAARFRRCDARILVLGR